MFLPKTHLTKSLRTKFHGLLATTSAMLMLGGMPLAWGSASLLNHTRTAYAVTAPEITTPVPVQTYDTPGTAKTSEVVRDTFVVVQPPKPKPKPKPKKVLKASAPGSASSYAAPVTASIAVEQAYARAKASSVYGWGDTQFTCIVKLWNKESGWNMYAENTSSGAYGIPQALPGNKMASMGSDWKNNYKTQINWGLWYFANSSYGTPCAAWAHSQAIGWY